MNIIIKIWFTLALITFTVHGQNIWTKDEIDYESYYLIYNLSIDSVHKVITNDNTESPSRFYIAAVKYLYYVKSDSEFLLNHLSTEIDTSSLISENTTYWYKVYTNIFFRGLLGDNTAVEKMKIIANQATYLPRLLAIRALAEIGIYDNYNFVIAGYNDSPELFINLLAWYGNDSRYKEEVKSIIMDKIALASITSEVIMLAQYLNIFSNEGTILLETYFNNTTGKERHDYFFELGILDKNGQPERSIFALQNETNDTLRGKYLPNAFEVLNYGFVSKRYLEPKFINSLKQINIADATSLAYRLKKNFLLIFTPSIPDSTKSFDDLLNNLYNYVDSVYNYNWLGDLNFSNELKNILTAAKTNLQNGDSLACRVQLKAFQDLVDNVYKDSLNADPRFVTIEGWKFLYWNAQYILDRLPEPQANPNLVVNLKNSLGSQMPASNVMYYDTSWKDAVNNGDGTFTVITTKPTVSVRVFYEGANQTVNNVPAQNNTYTFTTVNAAVQLKNSLGNLIPAPMGDQGTVQYYAGAWRSFGTTVNGVANKELLPINYSFRMTYEYGSQDKQQNISTDPTVVFQTVNAAVQLKNSLGNFIDQGTVQYYAGAWRSFGTTVNGIANKELLPVNYSFRMTYEYVSNDKQQNLSTNSTVTFSTILCTVKVTNANNQPLEGAATKYYSLSWRDIGLTNTNGITTKELLPSNISFRASYGNVSKDKQQDIGVNSLVEILLSIP